MAKKTNGIIQKLHKEKIRTERSIKSLQKRIDFLFFLSGRMIYGEGCDSIDAVSSNSSILKAYFSRIARLEDKQKSAEEERKAIFEILQQREYYSTKDDAFPEVQL